MSGTLARAIGLTATLEYPPGVVYPSTEGSGLKVFRFTPITDCMVLMAAMPSQPALNAALAGKVMSVILGVILAQTGMLAFALIQLHTSCTRARLTKGELGPPSMCVHYGSGVGVERGVTCDGVDR